MTSHRYHSGGPTPTCPECGRSTTVTRQKTAPWLGDKFKCVACGERWSDPDPLHKDTEPMTMNEDTITLIHLERGAQLVYVTQRGANTRHVYMCNNELFNKLKTGDFALTENYGIVEVEMENEIPQPQLGQNMRYKWLTQIINREAVEAVEAVRQQITSTLARAEAKRKVREALAELPQDALVDLGLKQISNGDTE